MKPCKYCDCEIHDMKIRCATCDSAWREGRIQGRDEIRGEVKDIFNKVKYFLQEEE